MAGRAGELTEKQRLFVFHYVRHRNASRAARQAGYSVTNAADTGYDLLHAPKYAHVQKALRDALAEERQTWEHTHETLIQQAMHIATFDPVDLVDEKGEYRQIQDIDPEARAAIAEVRVTQFTGPDGEPSVSRKYRASSKMEALTFLGKATGFLKDRIEHDFSGDIAESRARLDEAIRSALGPIEGLAGGACGQEPGEAGSAPASADGPAV